MAEAFIFDAVRTPRGKGRAATDAKPGGALCRIAPHELVRQLVVALGERTGPDVLDSVARLILGCVGQVGVQGGHIALVSRLWAAKHGAGLSDDVHVKTLNNYCVSGLTAINESALWARAGESGLCLAGGVEMLSQAPFLADNAAYYTDERLSRDLAWLPPIMGAELVATLEGLQKTDLDEITLASHRRAAAAWKEGRYDSSVIPVLDEKGVVALASDEWVRPGLTMEALEAMPPAFAAQGEEGADDVMLRHYPQLDKISHLHSVANTPGLSDGAALALTGSREAGASAGLRPRARILAMAETAGDPILQFGAGFDAMEQALKKAGVSLHQLDRIEFMEAFAAPPVKFLRRYQPDPERVNVNGGHLAMGHPMGATGAILTATLLHELERSGGALGLVVALAANGIGSALVMERV
ncbi:acetyl-CoA C-acyltransferase [Hyphococcus luteus]|uniref:Acetyl-CoA C-acyltransferase n=1 Tax=Hyphococcus luteus TaxID=2058213 RepID=A0A2S7K0N7_9PROT|nr:acetyl-CoA C-acyltransferase [Marinicaulis flavus]PQA85988.1 acetyl-CoA C-acyltransferase [Marinicaulis flavus]